MAINTDPNLTDTHRKAFAEAAKYDKKALAEIVTEYVDPVYLTLDVAGAFMNTREMQFGQLLVKRFKGKYHVQQIVPGQITLADQVTIRDKAVSYNLDILSAKAGYNTLELEHGGPQFTPETVRSDVQKALQERVLMRTWNALANIWTSGNATALTIPGATNSQYINAGGALTATSLDAAIDHVNFWSGSVKTIIGTEAALAPLSTFGQYQIIGTNNQYVAQNGQPAGTIQNVSPYGTNKAVESYRGVSNIIRLKQIFDDTEYPPRALLPNDFVLVVGDNIGEFITYGPPGTKEYIDNEPTPPYWNYETWLQFGMMIWNARGLVKIGNVSVTIP